MTKSVKKFQNTRHVTQLPCEVTALKKTASPGQWTMSVILHFTFFHSTLPQRQIKLKTDLQAVAVSVTLEKEITFCSVYIPPSYL